MYGYLFLDIHDFFLKADISPPSIYISFIALQFTRTLKPLPTLPPQKRDTVDHRKRKCWLQYTHTTFAREPNHVSVKRKMLLNFFTSLPKQTFPRLHTKKTILGNNVSATMFSRSCSLHSMRERNESGCFVSLPTLPFIFRKLAKETTSTQAFGGLPNKETCQVSGNNQISPQATRDEARSWRPCWLDHRFQTNTDGCGKWHHIQRIPKHTWKTTCRICNFSEKLKQVMAQRFPNHASVRNFYQNTTTCSKELR